MATTTVSNNLLNFSDADSKLITTLTHSLGYFNPKLEYPAERAAERLNAQEDARERVISGLNWMFRDYGAYDLSNENPGGLETFVQYWADCWTYKIEVPTSQPYKYKVGKRPF
tara:strand:- start:480 stop:818 length:339 start_codon:yes stop_codon:yes gene_type:complete